MIVDGKDVDVGMIVKFRTVNAKDPNLHQGAVKGIATYDVAKHYATDVLKYHQEVLETNPTIEEDMTSLYYLLIKDDNGDVGAYAIEWVQATTLEIIDVDTTLSFKVYHVLSGQANTILQLLQDNDFKAKLSS